MNENSSQIRVSYAQAVYGEEEMRAVLDVLKNPDKIVAGTQVKDFEKKIANLFGKDYGVMVNSGSSANLIALEALGLPKGSEVITPILTFSTTLAPIIQKGLVPIFSDVGIDTYVINSSAVENLITKKTKAIFIPLLLGNIPDLANLRQIAKNYGLKFIEDSCDTLGATFEGKPTGSYSDISTTSFYASHIITACGNGGMVCFHDPNLAKRALIMAYWGRESTLFGAYEKSEEIQKRFSGVLAGMTYDAKFIFTEIGYNCQPTEINGAFGLVQLKRLREFQETRKRNFQRLKKFFSSYGHIFILPQEDKRVETSWLAFPLTLRPGAPFSRKEITLYLENKNIQTRPIFTGNVLEQPAFRSLREGNAIKRSFPAADHIMKNGFLIGCHHGMAENHLQYLEGALKEFLAKY